MMLALLLARRNVPVTLLEAHPTFERDFRGDSIHPGLLEILDQIGLAERLHELPRIRVDHLRDQDSNRASRPAGRRREAPRRR